MRRIAARSVVLVVFLALLGACARAAAPSSGTSTTGIRGVVLLGPMCPVEQANSPCPDKPMADTEVDVMQSGAVVATATTDAQGRFETAVPAGTYIVQAVTTGIQSSRGVSTTVTDGSFSSVSVLVDSGIR